MPLTSVTCTLCENEYGKYCVPYSSQHRPAPQIVLRGGVWERETIAFMRTHARDRDIVHAGMFFGDFLPGLSSALSEGRVIYGFEPNKENFSCAQWTIAINNISNVLAFNYGLGENRETATMRVRDNGVARGGGSGVIWNKKNNIPKEDTETVGIISIDDVLPEDADIGILQLDVEGYEGPAVKGAIATIRRCKPILIVETVPEAVFRDIILPMGYKEAGKICENTIFTMP